MSNFSVSLAQIAEDLHLNLISTQTNLEEFIIISPEINRPGLFLAGYQAYFAENRVQILGNAEMGYLRSLEEDKRRERLEALFAMCPPTIIITRNAEPFSEIIELSSHYNVPVFTSPLPSSSVMNNVISLLSVELAQRATRHGVLVEVYGEGILILGDSGVGKSEAAVELLKRGHRLIADDAVELRRVSDRTIVGQSPENIRHFMELRGIGIINIARIFGAGAVKKSEKISLVAVLEPWDKSKNYNRTGLEKNTMDIMGVKIPLTVIPVMPGRNLAVIFEIAAINNRQKTMGYNAAKELLSQLGIQDDIETGINSVLIEDDCEEKLT